MKLFWAQGYRATSTRDLLNEISLKPGSLYSTFKNKEALLGEALNRYRDWLWVHMKSNVENNANPLDALHNFILETVVDIEGTPSHMCFVYKIQLELQGTEAENIPKEIYSEIKSWFLDRFKEAKEQKFIEENANPHRLAEIFEMNLLGWRGYLAVNGDRDFVRDEMDTFFARL